MVFNTICRERSAQIMQFLHFIGNTNPDLSDKMWKLHPLMHILKNSFLSNFSTILTIYLQA